MDFNMKISLQSLPLLTWFKSTRNIELCHIFDYELLIMYCSGDIQRIINQYFKAYSALLAFHNFCYVELNPAMWIFRGN